MLTARGCSYNEYIVFQAERIRLRYLALFKAKKAK